MGVTTQSEVQSGIYWHSWHKTNLKELRKSECTLIRREKKRRVNDRGQIGLNHRQITRQMDNYFFINHIFISRNSTEINISTLTGNKFNLLPFYLLRILRFTILICFFLNIDTINRCFKKNIIMLDMYFNLFLLLPQKAPLMTPNIILYLLRF